MPSSPRRVSRRTRFLQLALIAALTLAARLPFLLHGDRFFDSDEAVEGLMARHLLQGEFPIYLWGQHYKGVPEVYVAGLFFAAAGPTVFALKAATLACFALFVCVQFLLIDRLFSTRIAWMTAALTIVAPPSLVLWSLSGSAEIVMTLLAGAVMGLGIERWQRTGSLAACGVASAAVGFGLWVHQYIVYYLVALLVVAFQRQSARLDRVRAFVAARESPAWARAFLHLLLATAVVYVALGVFAFLTGGLDIRAGKLTIGLQNPQKLWRIAAGLVALHAGVRLAGRLLNREARGRRAVALASLLGFAVGYAPALADWVRGGGSAPIPKMNVNGLRTAMDPIVGQVLPMVLGFRSATTEWLRVPGWLGLVIGLTMLASYRFRSRQWTPFFHVFVIVTPLVFLLSGAFIDAQSYRYLMPLYAALPVVLAVGVDGVAGWRGLAGVALFSALLGVFAMQEVAWYQRLTPDTESAVILRCLRGGHIRAARADYWLSYKLTFLSREQVIVAPLNRVDRYPPYTVLVDSEPARVTVGRMGEAPVEPCHSILVQ